MPQAILTPSIWRIQGQDNLGNRVVDDTSKNHNGSRQRSNVQFGELKLVGRSFPTYTSRACVTTSCAALIHLSPPGFKRRAANDTPPPTPPFMLAFFGVMQDGDVQRVGATERTFHKFGDRTTAHAKRPTMPPTQERTCPQPCGNITSLCA